MSVGTKLNFVVFLFLIVLMTTTIALAAAPKGLVGHWHLDEGTGKIAKDVFEVMWKEKEEPDQIIKSKDLKQVSNKKEIQQIIDVVIKQNPSQLKEYKSGKDKLFGFFVGQVMKSSQGKANPKEVNKILREKLKE